MKYPISDADRSKIISAFTYHAPRDDQQERYISIRDNARELAYLLTGHCPSSRELSLALTNLEQAIMWANAAIARNE